MVFPTALNIIWILGVMSRKRTKQPSFEVIYLYLGATSPEANAYRFLPIGESSMHDVTRERGPLRIWSVRHAKTLTTRTYPVSDKNGCPPRNVHVDSHADSNLLLVQDQIVTGHDGLPAFTV